MKSYILLFVALLFAGLVSAQNVGIGTNNPTEKLHVNGNIRLADDADIFGVDIIQGFNDIRFLATPTSAAVDMYLSEDGNLGIGTTSPTEKLEVNGNIRLANGSQVLGVGQIVGVTGQTLSFQPDPNFGPVLSLGFDRNVYITNELQLLKTGTNGMIIHNDNTYTVSAGDQIFGDDTGTGTDPFIIASRENAAESSGVYGDGDHLSFWSPGDGAAGQPAALAYFLDEDAFSGADTDPFNTTALRAYLNISGVWQVSDERKKANIQPMANAIEKVQSLNGYTYEFLPNEQEIAKGDQPMPAAGVMAQDLKQVLPEAVNETQSGEYFVNYSAIVPLLIEAIKTQQTQIDQLESQIQELQAD